MMTMLNVCTVRIIGKSYNTEEDKEGTVFRSEHDDSDDGDELDGWKNSFLSPRAKKDEVE